MKDKDEFKTPSDLGGFGSQTIRMPDGSTVELTDLCYQSLRSAFVVRPWADDSQWDLFSYGRSQDVVGAPGLKATRAHTNLPRSGDSGLPKDWEAMIYRWRANLNVLLEQPVLDWASETSVHFEYNGKHYGDEKLIDLLFGAQPLSVGDAFPVHMRDGCSFKAVVLTGNMKALEELRVWLRGDTTKAANTELDMLVEVAKHFRGEAADAIVEGIRRVQKKTQPGRTLTGWVHLEGLMRRPVV